jgi:hypothetical protein
MEFKLDNRGLTPAAVAVYKGRRLLELLKTEEIMPGNIIRINDSSLLEWYIGDSKMDNLINYLDKNGHREHKDKMDMIESWVDSRLHEIANKYKIHIDVVSNIIDYIENHKANDLTRKENEE